MKRHVSAYSEAIIRFLQSSKRLNIVRMWRMLYIIYGPDDEISTSATLTYLLTNSMVQSPSWEANWFAASQEILRIFMEPEGS